MQKILFWVYNIYYKINHIYLVNQRKDLITLSYVLLTIIIN